MTILIKAKNFDKKAIDFIYDKQLQFKKEKKRMVSLESTVERLLKEHPDFKKGVTSLVKS